MAHVTGSAGSISALMSSIRSACTGNGWTLSGNVLHKGDVHIETTVVDETICFLGGTGVDGGNNLTGPGPSVVRVAFNLASITVSYPVTYELHINTSPDEVYVVVNYNTNDFQWAAWGQSDIADIGGTGVWYAAACNNLPGPTGQWIGGPNGANTGNQTLMHGLFYNTTSFTGAPLNSINSFIHNGIDAVGWTPPNGSTPTAWAWSAVAPLLNLLPNTWNDQTVLLPMPVFKPRSSGNKVSLLADLRHVRLCRVDYHNPGDIITLGTDQWKLYPWYRKNTAGRNGSSGSPITHSGTMGFAVRYTGS
jgi:hypothetical protein